MSLPDEKARAVKYAGEFLREIMLMRVTDIRKNAGGIRRRAIRILRHYPWSHDIEVMESALVNKDPGFTGIRGVRFDISGINKLIRDVKRAHTLTAKSKLRFP
jgi:hypothetical protein